MRKSVPSEESRQRSSSGVKDRDAHLSFSFAVSSFLANYRVLILI